MKTVARSISILLHPLLMPLYTIVLAFQLDFHLSFFLPVLLRWITFAMVFVMTVLFPITSAMVMIRGGTVSGLEMRTRQERIAPYVMTLVYYAMAYWLLKRSAHHEAVYAMFFGAQLALAAVLVITLRWKISAHMTGIGGLVGALLALFMIHRSFGIEAPAVAIAVAGLLGTARLVDSDHTPAQVYVGALLGFTIVFTCVVRLFHL